MKKDYDIDLINTIGNRTVIIFQTNIYHIFRKMYIFRVKNIYKNIFDYQLLWKHLKEYELVFKCLLLGLTLIEVYLWKPSSLYLWFNGCNPTTLLFYAHSHTYICIINTMEAIK